MTIDNKDGAAFLAYVTDKLETRIAHISQSILEGQKDIEGMHEYYCCLLYTSDAADE